MVNLARLSCKTASVLLQTLFYIETYRCSERLTGMRVLPWFFIFELALGLLGVMAINPLTIATHEVGGDHLQEFMYFKRCLV